MSTLMQYLMAFGLASSAGAKAAIPILALGLFHHTEYFELSERFAWIASPPVLGLLAVLVVVEFLADAHPEVSELTELAAYLPKAAAGFIAFSAATGTVDSSLLELIGSGLLGATTAVGVHHSRNRLRRGLRVTVEDPLPGVTRIASLGEAGASGAMASAAILSPPLMGVVLVATAVGAVGIARLARRPRTRRCPSCQGEVASDALACPHCGEDQPGP